VFTKAVDNLGILCYAGDLRQSGCICLMDCKFEASRGKTLGVEDLKSIWDVMEGGVIKDTRYKPANIPAGVPRIMGLQGGPGEFGIWFRDHDQANLGRFMDALAVRGKETTEAYKMRLNAMVKTFTAHEQAILRRVSCGIPVQPLVSQSFVDRLEVDSVAAAGTQMDRRQAYWAAKKARGE
jgi:hypothetical protein